MEFIGTLITYLMMACCVAGGSPQIVNDQSELGRAFQDGLHAMANMFIPDLRADGLGSLPESLHLQGVRAEYCASLAEIRW